MLRFTNIIFFILLMKTAVGYTYTPCDPDCFDQASAADLETILIGVYGPTFDDYVEIPASDPLSVMEKIDPAKPTLVFAYGWTGEVFLNRIATEAVIKSHIELKNSNVILLNWSKISLRLYSFAARSVEAVGYVLATLLNKLVESGLDSPGIHIIGHSLGAQICGFTGKNVNFPLLRITGLDPAGPKFTDPARRLNSTDAKFVVVIHTNGGGLGIVDRSGTVDFYPNGGLGLQPGCGLGLDICSHYRSCYIWAESVKNQTAFIGRACDSESDFDAGLCNLNSKAVMGYATPSTALGMMYLRTNSRSPYGLGIDGAVNQAP